jgi:8-oxo-dGTP diphosphatase
MAKPIVVTAAIIEDNGKYLITQRLKEAHNGGRWEFPGGKLEFGEDPRDCLKREIDEELGIEVQVNDLFEYSSHVYNSEKHILLLGFHCKFISGDIEHKEIADYKWISCNEMNKYDITEADIPFVNKLIKECKFQ